MDGRGVSREVRALIAAACEGTISTAEQAELDRAIAESQEVARYYCEYFQVHADLYFLASTEKLLDDLFSGLPQSTSVAGVAPPGLSATPVATPSVLRQAWHRGMGYLSDSARFGLFFAAVSTVSLLLFFAQIRLSEQADVGSGVKPAGREQAASRVPVVARLTRAVGCRWAEHSPAMAAGTLLAQWDELQLRDGRVEIAFADGARITLTGPARLRLDSAGRATLAHGKLFARVPPAAIGFRVDTPWASITDLGTEFGVVVTPQQMETHVFRGAVQLDWGEQRERGERLWTGASRRITARAGGFSIAEQPAPSPTQFMPEAEFDETPPASRGPVAYWRFEESLAPGGLASDRVGGHTAELRGQAASTKQLFAEALPHSNRPNRGALDLPGHPAAYLQVPHHPTLNLAGDGFTIEAWVRLHGNLGLHSRQHLVHKKPVAGVADSDTEYAFVVAGGGYSTQALFGKRQDVSGRELVLLLGAPRQSEDGLARIVSHLEVTRGRWHYVSVSFDPLADQVRFVLDDQVETLHVPLFAVHMSDGPLIVGGHFSSEGENRHPFQGAIDELRISRGALPLESLLRVPRERAAPSDAAPAR